MGGKGYAKNPNRRGTEEHSRGSVAVENMFKSLCAAAKSVLANADGSLGKLGGENGLKSVKS